MFTDIGVEVAPDIDALTGDETAVSVLSPRSDGRQAQVAVWLEPDPEVKSLLHPGKTLPFKQKVILEATETLAEIDVGVRKVAALIPPGSESELNIEVTFIA